MGGRTCWGMGRGGVLSFKKPRAVTLGNALRVHRYWALSSQALRGQGLSLANDPPVLCLPGPQHGVLENTQNL